MIWYYVIINSENSCDSMNRTCDNDFYAMDESLDLRHVVCGNITLKQWFRDKKKSKAFALWYSKDLRPTVAQYFYLLKELIKRHGV